MGASKRERRVQRLEAHLAMESTVASERCSQVVGGGGGGGAAPPCCLCWASCCLPKSERGCGSGCCASELPAATLRLVPPPLQGSGWERGSGSGRGGARTPTRERCCLIVRSPSVLATRGGDAMLPLQSPVESFSRCCSILKLACNLMNAGRTFKGKTHPPPSFGGLRGRAMPRRHRASSSAARHMPAEVRLCNIYMFRLLHDFCVTYDASSAGGTSLLQRVGIVAGTSSAQCGPCQGYSRRCRGYFSSLKLYDAIA
jgi:hypothetical protein